MNEIKVLDLFSGIGGFSLGLERAGPFRTVAFCEREPFCQAVLQKHWPDTPIYDDVRTIDTDGLGKIDLICGGFPCQPWSVAGEQRGAEDDRDLWPIMAALIEDLRPRWVIGENVRGFVNEPMGLERSLSDLESIGYQAVPFIIPACAVNAPHRRDRVWIVAHSRREHGQSRGEVTGNVRKESANRRSRNRAQRSGRDVADAESRRVERDRAARQQKPQTPLRQRLFGRDSAGSGAGHWATEPSVGRVATGVRNRTHRLRALGNAVVPQVVEKIGRAIITTQNETRDSA
ncbi:MAG: DNA (cytosine-5-)-methyltransferase [Parvibaculum sp.]|nr:DNA (cytosine-5-)-methyltransferase [Parvibaculum sp.]